MVRDVGEVPEVSGATGSQRYITADVFVRAFQAEWLDLADREPERLEEAYRSDTEWTDLMLKSEHCLLKAVLNRILRDGGWPNSVEYVREYYTIDALYVGDQSILDGWDPLSYPSQLYALIEHENGEWVEEELWKLLHWKAPLKVLIFYDYDDADRTGKKGTWLRDKLDCLSTMETRVSGFYRDREDTEYLLLIGARNEVGEIYWRKSTDFRLVTEM